MGLDDGSRYTFEYNPTGQLNGASTDHTAWDYNADDTVQKITDARSAYQTLSYNARQLVTGVSYGASGSGIQNAPSVSFAYDAAGNRTSMTDGLGSASYSYDQLSRLTSESRTITNVGTFPLTYSYNLANELTSIADPWSATVDYGFDATGRMNNISGSGYGSVSQFASNLQYRAWGALKGLTYGNNLTLSLGYNARLQATQYEVSGRPPQYGSATVMKTQYQYYSDGGLKFADDLLDERFDRAFSYDQVGMLKEAYSGSQSRETQFVLVLCSAELQSRRRRENMAIQGLQEKPAHRLAC
ncbi:MAG: hypothetical protein ACRD9S_22300 [Pyrinomonadaceae bacterium]